MLLVFFGPNGSFTQLKYGVAGEVLGKGGGGEGGKGVVTTSCLLVRMSKLPSE